MRKRTEYVNGFIQLKSGKKIAFAGPFQAFHNGVPTISRTTDVGEVISLTADKLEEFADELRELAKEVRTIEYGYWERP